MGEVGDDSMIVRIEGAGVGMVDPLMAEHSAPVLRAVRRDEQADILGVFSLAQQQEIKYKLRLLTSLACFIGNDFNIPVVLNRPGQGWHWNFAVNEIRVDPQDLVRMPLDYLRFIISHEGAHRRISRVADIPQEIWTQPGFSFMVNAIEDPRVNNFLADAYPTAREQMNLVYNMHAQIEAQAKKDAKDKLGFQPRFETAGFEYIKQWFRSIQGQPVELSDDLAPEVRKVVGMTLESARDAWLRYPTKMEADQGEELIERYAKVSYEIQRDEVWPEFKKLVDQDIQDQVMQELMQQMMQQSQSGAGEGEEQSGQGVPQDLMDKLTPEQQEELEQAMQQAQQSGQPQVTEGQPQPADGQPGHGQGSAVDLDSLSPELKQKIKDYIDSQPQATQEQLEEMARAALKELEDLISEQLQGRLSDDPDKKADREAQQKAAPEAGDNSSKRADEKGKPSDHTPPLKYEETDDFRAHIEQFEKEMDKDKSLYERNRREVLSVIDALEGDLREIFLARRADKWHSGFRTGKSIDIKKRIQEKALRIPAVESRAWQRRELPQEKDYAITILVDLSNSMSGHRISQTFKGVIVLAEVLNRLSIPTEILGFNDRLYVYQPYGQGMSQEIRDSMGTMLSEVVTERAIYNDDGFALEEASARLATQKATEKFLFVLSDGIPEPSPAHSGPKYELDEVVRRVMSETDQKLIGLGVGQGTGHVTTFYPNSIANIDVREMPNKLADVIREAIANYDTF